MNQPTIQRLTERLVATRGLDSLLARRTLGDYLKGITDAEFISQAERVSNFDIFSHLFSMGMNRVRQDACVTRWQELTR